MGQLACMQVVRMLHSAGGGLRAQAFTVQALRILDVPSSADA